MLTYPHFTPHFPRDQWVLPQVLAHQARERPDRPFLSWTDAGRPHSFAEIDRITNRLAHGFRALGVRKGELVALFLPNCPDYVFAWFALQKLGAVEVAVSDLYKGAFLTHPLRLAKARLVLATPELAQRMTEIEADIPTVERCILVDPPGAEPGPAPAFGRIRCSRFAELYADDDSDPQVTVTPEDTAAVLLTSGTTGPSKGVVMPHSQFYFFAEEDVQLVRLKADDVYMTGFPLFHGNAQFLTVYPCLIAGAHCVLYPKFSATDFIGRARRSGATVTNLLGATMAFICAQPASEDDRSHKLRRIFAAPLSPDLAGKFTDRFGVSEFVEVFGQTEISNPFMTPPDAPRPPGAAGCVVDQYFEVRLSDPETGEEVPVGTMGELWIRPKALGIICTEYLGMPEKTVEAWRDLWFHTGDAMKRDAEGWYYFLDRVKDALRRRGENISSFEVESVVRSHPAVAECAVVAAEADEEAGEDEVKACLILKDGATIDFPELIAWCDSRMPAFMVPRYLEILDELPRTPSEKVQKKVLRERGHTAGTWDRVKAGCRLSSERPR